MPEACSRCGVRGDVGCKHRPAAGSAPPAVAHPRAKHDARSRPNSGQGFNFHRAKLTQSLRGKAGNPTSREFQELLPPGWRTKK